MILACDGGINTDDKFPGMYFRWVGFANPDPVSLKPREEAEPRASVWLVVLR